MVSNKAPLPHKRFAKHLLDPAPYGRAYAQTSISEDEGEFMRSAIVANRYRSGIEVGCALGISSLYILDGFQTVGGETQHTIIDPGQSSQWSNIGVLNIEACGFNRFRIIEEPSEIALPKLTERQEAFDFGFIDGWHTFDHALVDFFYLNRMIRVGGMIVLDDARWPSVSRVIDYLEKYPHYESATPRPRVGGAHLRYHAFRKVAKDTRSYKWFENF